MNDELEGIWKEALVSQRRNHLGIFLEGLRKDTRDLSEDTSYSGENYTRACPYYKSKVLPPG
jgi:phage replication-related protein YjqB (UPF0714/DUF867 family)